MEEPVVTISVSPLIRRNEMSYNIGRLEEDSVRFSDLLDTAECSRSVECRVGQAIRPSMRRTAACVYLVVGFLCGRKR